MNESRLGGVSLGMKRERERKREGEREWTSERMRKWKQENVVGLGKSNPLK